MPFQYVKTKVFENIEISNNIFRLSVEMKTNEKPKPGQFAMLRCSQSEPILGRPISLYDAAEGILEFVFEARGEGTKNLSKLKKGDDIEIIGLLGNGFDVENIEGRVAVVSGGVGIAPMNYLIKSLRNCTIDLYAGFRCDVYGLDGVRELVDNVYITTEDGSCGTKGFVTKVFNEFDYDLVLCCGPEPMMKSIVEICNTHDLPIYVSMEKHMACGVGACLVCTCKTKDGNKRTCKDGPVFLGRDVIFDA